MNKIELREACRLLLRQSARPPAKKKDYSGTAYTGLIKSVRDLAYWASVPDWKHRCRWCDKGINHYGLCHDCERRVTREGRCIECFDVIVNTDLENANMICSGTSTCCASCCNKSVHVGNPHGYKEGGTRSGQLRTNYRTDNQNDNNAKTLEERRI